jgi:hypothetical protein
MFRLSLATCLAIVAVASAEFPTLKLEGNGVALTVLVPDAKAGYYRGTRFDWGAIVSKVDYAGHTLFQDWKPPHDPTGPDDVHGTAEEFGSLKLPPGYAAAKPGETFLKIGVGKLEKPDDKPYQFNRRYKLVEAAPWTVTPAKSEIRFHSAFTAADGTAYAYTKVVRLLDREPGFAIDRVLENTGKTVIDTDHYGHNFLSIDGKPIGPDYRFTFGTTPKLRESKNDWSKIARLDGASITFTKPFDREMIYAELEGMGDTPKSHEVTVADVKSGFSVTIAGDRPVKEWHFWGLKSTMCPEPFVEFRLEPGQKTAWSTSYRLKK